MQIDMFGMNRQPVTVAWGGGLDSTAMIVEMHERGEQIDLVTFANLHAERPWTYDTVAY